MRISCIIIDDEPNNVENLQSIISTYCPDFEVVATSFDAADGSIKIKAHQPDLIFLDIQMPEASGFDLLRSFTSINFEVIFITAYDQYGIQAIKFSALDYLLKPINIAEFRHATARAKEKIVSKKRNYSIDNLLDYMKTGQRESPKIALPLLNEIIYVKVNTIIRCEADNNYTKFFLESLEQILVCKTLKDFVELLEPHGFARTHQSHLVNLNFVKSYLKEDGGTLLLNDQTKIPISRQNREKIRDLLSKG
ncbi:MAG: LytTR family DNA-binding domain-containing protein [Pedobacter sp.]